MKKVIIIGATSGIGKELAKIFSNNGYEVGITGRRTNLLEKLGSELSGKNYAETMDISTAETAIESLEKLIKKMGEVDIIIINAGISITNKFLDWNIEKEVINTNVSGFTAMASAAMRYFFEKEKGHLVGVSSILGIRGSHIIPAYCASKAFVSNYLDCLRIKAMRYKKPIYVTDILPGFVDTEMLSGDKKKGAFWIESAQKAAEEIYDAVKRKKKKAYITKRWVLIAMLLKILPDKLYSRI
jgi:short-subunit dehydrogenase